MKNIEEKFQNRGVREILNSLLIKTPIGTHQLFVYPNLDFLGEVCFYYIRSMLIYNNQLVVYLPLYETVNSIKNILISNSYGDTKSKTKNTLEKYIANGSLILIDSRQVLFSNSISNTKNENRKQKEKTKKEQKNIQIIDIDNKIINIDTISTYNNDLDRFSYLLQTLLNKAKKLGKTGITIIIDYGYRYLTDNGNEKNCIFKNLLDLEKSITLSYYSVNHIKITQVCLYHQNNLFRKLSKMQKSELLDLHTSNIIMT